MKFAKVSMKPKSTPLTEEEFNSRLSLEAHFADNVIVFFKDSISSITSLFRNLLPKFDKVKNKIDINTLESRLSSLEHKKLDIKYLSYRNILIQVPEGFQGEFLECVIDMNRIGQELISNTEKLFKEYQTFISALISNPSRLESSKDILALCDKFVDHRVELSSRIGKYYNNSTNSRDKLGTVIPRFKDLRDLNKQIKILKSKVELSEIKKIEALVSATSKLLGVIEQRVTSKETSEIDSRIVKNISKGAYELARYVDQVVVYYYNSMTLIGCYSVLLDKLNKLE